MQVAGPRMSIDEALDATYNTMLATVHSEVDVLRDASRHIISARGKLIRPRLTFLAYQVAGGHDIGKVVPVAAAIELVHTATLVHDDINDHGVTRRGRITVNELWGRTFALLTGDFLFAKVYALMAPFKELNITLAEATVALVEGETLQAAAAKNNSLNRETYQMVASKKTAALFRAAAVLGAQLAEGDRKTRDALGEYGFYLGLAFQIVDDLLDLTGDPRLMGKQAGVDLEQGKGVVLAVSAHNGDVGHKDSMAVVEAQESDPILEMKQRLLDGGAVEEGRRMSQVLAAQANSILDKLPDSQASDELRQLVKLVVERDH